MLNVLRVPVYALLLTILLGGCDKDINAGSCEEFKTALKENDKEAVRKIVDQYIKVSGSISHTSENLQKLVQYISKKCNVDVSIICYGCIDTLPEMSEILIEFQDGFTTVRKLIDISNGHNDNLAKFVGMHD